MMGTPFVMVYRVSPLTYFLGKRTVKVPYFAMVNLIAEKEIVPELVQHSFTSMNVVNRLEEILPDGARRSQMVADLAEVKAKLEGPVGGGLHAPDRAAEIISDILADRPKP
jgi:lipid-A-disaccharide synthase